MRNLLLLSVAFSIMQFCYGYSAFGQTTDDDLKKMILDIRDIAGSRQGIALAVERNRPGVLVAAIVDPTWGRKGEAVEALAKLPTHEQAVALTQVLGADDLFVPALGGRGKDVQDDFVTKLRSALSVVCGKDLSKANLYVQTVRQQVITNLKAL